MGEHLSWEPDKNSRVFSPENEKPSPKEAMFETGDVIVGNIKQGQDLYEDSVAQIENYERKKNIAAADLKAKAEEKKSRHFFEQHLNLVHLYNFWGPSPDLGHDQLSPASQKLYADFVGSLSADSIDSTEEAVAEILKALEDFEKKYELENEQGLPKDLASFFKQYYSLFQDVHRLARKRKKKNVRPLRVQAKKQTTSHWRSWWQKITNQPDMNH